MWGAIEQILNNNYGIICTRSALLCNLKYILRDFQHGSTARKLVSTKFPSGHTVEEFVDQVTKHYFQNSGMKDSSGTFKNSVPFTYQDTSYFIYQH